jgi:DNA repair ATPase RecN
MLTYHLKSALENLRDIIEITQNDIDDIKEAKHDPQFERLPLKEEKLKSFETKKAMIDHTIANIVASHPNTPLPDLLDEQQHQLLTQLREELDALHEINKRYAKLVLAVSNLYNEFLEQIVPTEMQGYKKVAAQKPSFLEVRV